MKLLFRYDLVDISRQALHLLVIPLYHDLIRAYNAKSAPQVAQIGIKLLNMFDDLDKILQTNHKFLLECWLNSAKAMGTTPEEVKLYEKMRAFRLLFGDLQGSLTTTPTRCGVAW